jgi:hypothetical protein
MATDRKAVLVRILVCYLIAAAIHTLVVAVATKPPHSGMGPLVIFFLLFFWATPTITVAQLLLQGDDLAVYDVAAAKRIAYFAVPFVVALLIAFRHQLRSGARGKRSDV